MFTMDKRSSLFRWRKKDRYLDCRHIRRTAWAGGWCSCSRPWPPSGLARCRCSPCRSLELRLPEASVDVATRHLDFYWLWGRHWKVVLVFSAKDAKSQHNILWYIVSLFNGWKVVTPREILTVRILGISLMFILINSWIIPPLDPHKYLTSSQVYDQCCNPFHQHSASHSFSLSLSLSPSCLLPPPFCSI